MREKQVKRMMDAIQKITIFSQQKQTINKLL